MLSDFWNIKDFGKNFKTDPILIHSTLLFREDENDNIKNNSIKDKGIQNW